MVKFECPVVTALLIMMVGVLVTTFIILTAPPVPTTNDRIVEKPVPIGRTK